MSEHESEQDETGISDDQLPDDLVPSEDNPLAEGLDDGETVDDLMDGGKEPDQSDDGDDSDDTSDSNDSSDAIDASGSGDSGGTSEGDGSGDDDTED